MIAARAITKRYGAIDALVDIDLDVAAGECLGLSGSTGSGRATLLRILATRVPPTSGTLAIGGTIATGPRLFAVRQRIGYAGDPSAAGTGLRVDEYLRLILHTRGAGASVEYVRRVRGALADADIDSEADIDTLVPPARLLVESAAALLVSPAVLLLDLRTSDGCPRTAFLECLSEARSRGTTIVLASDDTGTLDGLCSRSVQLEGGRLTKPEAIVMPEMTSAVTERG